MDVGSGSNSGTNKSHVDRTPGGAGHRKEYGRNNPAGGGSRPLHTHGYFMQKENRSLES